MTSHELAQQLLMGPDLPIFHVDPSQAGMNSDSAFPSASEPQVELVDDTENEDGEEGKLVRFLTIRGMGTDEDEGPMNFTSAGAGVALIAAERCQHPTREGWTAEHDDGHKHEQMACAAAVYATPAPMCEYYKDTTIPKLWPWHIEWWKPSPENRIRELVKAGALLAGEIDRLLRAKKEKS